MLSWASILYGATLSAAVAGAALTALVRPRQPAVTLTQSGRFRIGPAPASAAIATTDVTVYEDPSGDAAITAVFPAKLPWGSPTSFLVREVYRDAAGRTWTA
jgi:hypothetical protein